MKKIATGVVNVREENGVFYFSRFTSEQEALYLKEKQDYHRKTLSTAGVKLYFKTDSKNLFIKLRTEESTSRKYFSLDVHVNKNPIGHIDNFSDVELERDYTVQEFSQGEFSKNFDLGDGEKEVCVHFPWSVKTFIEEVSIDDGCYVEGIKAEKKLLAFGDSITHGYDALRPANRYIVQLADRIGAEEINKGIGGEMFFPELADLKEPFVPDYITVAYGTNDWNCTDCESFRTNCKEFYKNLANNYPDSKIFAITPIWRKDRDEFRKLGAFESVEQYIKEVVSEYKNITFVSGYDLVPKEENYFSDLYLHPNDDGFAHYVNNLYDKIKNEI